MGRILIVEDDELIAALEKDYLETGGFEAEVDFDGRDTVRKNFRFCICF